MVSPQFHIKVDDTFETIQGLRETTHGTWREKCGFTREMAIKHQPAIKQNGRTDDPENVIRNNFVPEIANAVLNDGQTAQQDVIQNEGANDNEIAPVAQQQPNLPINQPARRSQRNWRPTQRYLESLQQETVALPVALQAAVYDSEYKTITDDIDPISLLAKTDKDTMYFDQAMKQHDAPQFIQAAIDEVATHQDNGHWEVVPISDVPENITVLDAVWSMRRKRRLLTNEIYKWKARLNIHGGQQELGINYWETYAPVVTWAAIRLILVLVLLYNWYTLQIDFVLAYPQADVECEMYMKIPKGFEIDGKTNKTHVLKLLKNLYGQKQAGRVWNQHLHKALIELGWKRSKADDCLYYKGNVLFVVYVDDGILVSPNQDNINKELKLIQERLNISVEGTLSDYVGVNIERTEDGKIHMTQPNIIKSILEELNFKENTKERSTPAYSSTILKDGLNKEPHNADWNYRRIIGKLNFLCSSCRPEISCAVHQAARFSANPRVNHTEAIKRIA
jgi:hypothetical protein